ncbi:hypothetical protein [Pseudofulvimonas gallinarii]|uniref:Parallel beta helix pectate lyase-like protein n=1 Tax=Pseudofulvimonas gallinarii TaxID=634155 RepID=A0A4S3L2M1_9GAMM|nr:hypothetical protein [Pseudofulvimonas gallinarii]TCT01292.1 hypothetical protein EDC25_101152 [Pseudofulvimonas gallinarii]THD15054.1 hypothetical protein B1808_01240 [Pseudofulvimonas gallinarii]
MTSKTSSMPERVRAPLGPQPARAVRHLLALFFGLFVLSAGTAWAGGGELTAADFNLPPQDAQGWSVLTPSVDSRLIYVDSTNGSDGNGQVYSPSSPQIGPDPTRPVGQVQAFRTLSAAIQQVRNGQPDWMLLRAGRVWQESLPIRRGRSPAERSVITSWGDGARPELRTGTGRGISGNYPENLAIIGLRFWAHTRDPEGPFFTSYDGSDGFSFISTPPGQSGKVRNVLIEDCFFRSYESNGINGALPREPVERIVIRRSIISRNFKSAGEGHSQGLYHTGRGQTTAVPVLMLQENLFDHNGWRIQSTSNNGKEDGQATIFNHNTYFSSTRNILFQRNLFLRASSIGNKWTAYHDDGSLSENIVIEDNLYAEGEIGISIGGNEDEPFRFDRIGIRNNVFTDIGRTRPTNRSLSWSVEAKDWHTGEITGNLFIHQRAAMSNVYGLAVVAIGQAGTILVENNVFGNMRGGSDGIVRLLNGNNVENVLFHNNVVQSPTATPLVALQPGGYVFSGNNLYHSTSDEERMFRVNGDRVGLPEWIAASGDTGATVAPIGFPAPERDLETYVAHVGLGSGFEDFLTAVYGQSRSSWNPALTAGVINDWLRAGFGMPQTGGDVIFADGFQP